MCVGRGEGVRFPFLIVRVGLVQLGKPHVLFHRAPADDALTKNDAAFFATLAHETEQGERVAGEAIADSKDFDRTLGRRINRLLPSNVQRRHRHQQSGKQSEFRSS